jgi:hypothetical protein
MTNTKILSLFLMGGMAVPAFAGVVWDESVNGTFSSNRLSPTSVAVSLGSNQILGTNGANAVGGVRDYVTFTVPTGDLLRSITMLTTNVGAIGFIGIEAGNQLTLLPTVSDATGLLGWLHYTAANEGADILPLMGTAGMNATDFVPPLPAGAYTLWIQDSSPTGTGIYSYGFDLGIQAAPEPATWGSAVTALLGLGVLLKRRRSA